MSYSLFTPFHERFYVVPGIPQMTILCSRPSHSCRQRFSSTPPIRVSEPSLATASYAGRPHYKESTARKHREQWPRPLKRGIEAVVAASDLRRGSVPGGHARQVRTQGHEPKSPRDPAGHTGAGKDPRAFGCSLVILAELFESYSCYSLVVQHPGIGCREYFCIWVSAATRVVRLL